MSLLAETGYPLPLDHHVSRRMRANRRTGTKPESELRAEIHALGLRFRKDFGVRAGGRLIRPDVVFTRWRVAVFLDGCYWHRCPEHGTSPRTNFDYWSRKLQHNVDRDRVVDAALASDGWEVIRVWEHEDRADAALRIAHLIHSRTG